MGAQPAPPGADVADDDRDSDWYRRRLPDLQDLLDQLGDDPVAVLLNEAANRGVADRSIVVDVGQASPEAVARASLARKVVEKLLGAPKGSPIAPADRKVLDLVTLVVSRPALFVRDGLPLNPPPGWEIVEQDAAILQPNVKAVGCVRIGEKVLGSAILVGPDRVLTNNHVVAALCDPTNQDLARWLQVEPFALEVARARKAWPAATDGPVFDLGREAFGQPGRTVKIHTIRALHPAVELAVLDLEDAVDDVRPVSLSARAPEHLEDDPVYVVGYPCTPPQNGHGGLTESVFVLEQVFGSALKKEAPAGNLAWTLETRRLAPGRLEGLGAGYPPVPPGRHLYNGAIGHDAATLGGNSGSAVFDFRTHQAVAVHFGFDGARNFAVPLWRHATDPWFAENGVVFAGRG